MSRPLQVESLEDRLVLTPGLLDKSFGTAGIVTTNFNGPTSMDLGNDMAIQTDGKIVVVGYTFGSGPTATDWILARYLPSGALDPTFGTGGRVITDFYGSFDDNATGVALQPDGKIIVVGQTHDPSTGENVAMARYNTDGSLDSSFGPMHNGRVVTHSGYVDDAPNWEQASDVMVLPSGTIVVVGDIVYGGSGYTHCFVAQYLSTGFLDSSFDGDGMISYTYSPTFGSTATAVTYDSTMLKYVIAGNTATGSGSDFAVARLNPSGTLDSSFGVAGRVATTFGFSSSDAAHTLAVVSSSRIVAAGISEGDFAMIRYNSDGTVDSSFGTSGYVTTDFGGFDSANELLVQPSGKLVLVGTKGTSSSDVALARYKDNGALDTWLGTSGKVVTTISAGSIEGASGAALQSDGKIVIAGSSNAAGSPDFLVARYHGDFARRFLGSGPSPSPDPAPGPDDDNGRFLTILAASLLSDSESTFRFGWGLELSVVE
jgi:uncharacterized delta-60 repeat protein